MFESIIESMNVTSYDPLVVAALGEYSHRYAIDLLSDAKDYAVHANRHEITLDDIMLAISSREAETAKREAQNALALENKSSINNKELPQIPITTAFHWPKNGNVLTQSVTYMPAGSNDVEGSFADGGSAMAMDGNGNRANTENGMDIVEWEREGQSNFPKTTIDINMKR